MTRICNRRAGARAGTTAFLLFALYLTALLSASSASAFTDVNTITGTETWPNVTQTGSVVANRPGTSQILVAYTDGRGALENPDNFLGLSVSSNNGETFTRLGQPTQFTGHGTGYGSPILAWDQKRSRWTIGQLASGCGGKGIGLWYSTNGTTWTLGPCAHSGTADEKPTMSIDNNPSSPYYGRIYITFTDSSAAKVAYSADSITWSANGIGASVVSPARNVQVASSQLSSGVVWASAVSAPGGFEGVGANQWHFVQKSTDGGVTWSAQAGYVKQIAGNTECLTAALSFGSGVPWRNAGFGQLAVKGNGEPLYAYAAKGTSDASDVYLNGVKMNTDTGTALQWNPSVRAGSNGAVVLTWYDNRIGGGYQRYQRISYDYGLTWGKDEPLSSTKSPYPYQPNPSLPLCFSGGGDVASSGTGLLGYDTWTDGRVSMEGKSVEKVFFHAISLVP